MIDFSGLNEVRQRISNIEARFGINTGTAGAFQKDLSAAMTSQGASRQSADKTAAAGKGKTASNLASTDGALGSMIKTAAAKYNVDARLVSAVAETESGGNQDSVSSAGAIGVMQLMPDTAAALGVNPYEESQNIEGGTKYLRQMLDTFGGDVRKAVAAYNAGSQAVKDYNGVPPYKETQNYVDKVLDLYQ